MIKVGVTAFQGDVEEHIITVERAMDSMGIEGRAIPIREKMVDVDALIIPGGESTTISSLMIKTGVFDEIKKIADDIPIMGTCAGCILLSKEVDYTVKTLELMDMEVERNAFGRQKESFQCLLDIEGFDKPFPAVFIRAPLIKRVWGNCKVMAKIDNDIVMAREDNKLALTFHPELTDDLRIHQYFLNML